MSAKPGRLQSPAATIAAIGAALFIASPALTMLAPVSESLTAYDTQIQREARNSSSFALMLGEFRTSIGDMLFIKTERYLDSGVGYEPHIDARELESSGIADLDPDQAEQAMDASIGNAKMAEAATIAPGTVASHGHDEHEDHDHGHHDEHGHDQGHHDEHGHDQHDEHAADSHEGHDHGSEETVETLIKTADKDFRGFIGHLEREVKPWRDPEEPHQHTAGTELLPWYRLATLSDPHNVRNYVIGAWWLKSVRTDEQLNEALNFLDEGIAANPDAYDLNLMKGYILRQMNKLEEARKNFALSAEKALKERPATGPVDEPGVWDITDEEQMEAAITMHVLLTRDLESTGTAIELTRQYKEKIPEAGAVQRLMMTLPGGN